MGSICSPQIPREEQQQQNLKIYNEKLREIMIENLESQNKYQWARELITFVQTLDNKYLFKTTFNDDITNLVAKLNETTKSSSIRKTLENHSEYQDKLSKSFLIPEDQTSAQTNQVDSQSFLQRVNNNPSIMIQFETIYKPFIEQQPYRQSTSIFLSWITIAQKHLRAGFLKAIYQKMVQYLKQYTKKSKFKESNLLLKSMNLFISSFSNVLWKIYRQVYHFDTIQSKGQKGKLFKQQNINHFIICNIFKTQQFMRYLRDQLIECEQQYIKGFNSRLKLAQTHSFDHFNIPHKFRLMQFVSDKDQKQGLSISLTKMQSYRTSTNILKNISSASTPISKSKILLQVSKQIVKQIKKYYEILDQQPPELDSDTLTSLIMFIIVKSGLKQLPIDLQIIEQFSSQNALNSISGYYMRTFSGAVSVIDTN